MDERSANLSESIGVEKMHFPDCKRSTIALGADTPYNVKVLHPAVLVEVVYVSMP